MSDRNVLAQYSAMASNAMPYRNSLSDAIGMAYGTSWEPFVDGSLAMIPNASGFGQPTVGRGSPQTADIYANGMRETMRSPLAAYDPSPAQAFGVHVGRPAKDWGVGFYLPSRDYGEVGSDAGMTAGDVFGHEVTHRSLRKLANDVTDPSVASGLRDVGVQHFLLGDMAADPNRNAMRLPNALAADSSDPATRYLSPYDAVSALINDMRSKRGDFRRMGPR